MTDDKHPVEPLTPEEALTEALYSFHSWDVETARSEARHIAQALSRAGYTVSAERARPDAGLLSRDNPKSRWHREQPSPDRRESWACVPLTDALAAPTEPTLTPLQREVATEPSCSRCQRDITRLDDLFRCAQCKAAFHLTCIYEHFGWSVNGPTNAAVAEHAAPTEPTLDVEHEHYWTDAPDDEEAWYCPSCGLTEYPNGSAVFGSAAPTDARLASQVREQE